jgi:type VI protein secretion system component VasF
MIPGDDGKHETDPDKLCQFLDLKLAQERAAWKRARAQRNTIRAVSFVFLFLLIVAALVGFFLIFSRAAEHRSNQSQSTMLPDR